MSILTYPLGFIGGGVLEPFYNGVVENSMRFDGTAHLLRTPQQRGTSLKAFTYSFWYKMADLGSQKVVLSQYDSGTDVGSFTFQGDDTLDFIHWTGSYAWQVKPTQVFRDPSAWVHIVIVHDSAQETAVNRQRFYINGKKVTVYTTQGNSSQNFESATLNTAQRHSIGNRFDGSADNKPLEGHLADFYFIDGHALGSENFGEFKNRVWVPKTYTGPPPLITDSSPSAHSVANYQYSSQPPVSLDYQDNYIGNSALSFVAENNNSLWLGDSADWDFGDGDWTIETWFYRRDGSRGNIWYRYLDGNNQARMDFDENGSDNVYFSIQQSGSYLFEIKANTAKCTINRWHHLAFTRSGTIWGLYIDGESQPITFQYGSVTSSASTYDVPLGICGDPDSQQYNGLLDEFRVIKGEAFLPRFYFGTNYGDQDEGRLAHRATTADRFADDERTVFLVSGQSANNHARSVSLVDESGMHLDNVHTSNSTYSTYPTQDGVGNQFTISGPQHTTKESFIGNTSSIVFDGVDDYLSIPDSADWSFGTGAFTLDAWVNIDLVPDDQRFFGQYEDGNNRWYFGVTSATRKFIIYSAQGGTTTAYYTNPVNKDPYKYNTWTHICMIRSGTSVYLYVDAELQTLDVTQAIGSSAWGDDAAPLRIGTINKGAAEWLHGYMDEARIIKGTVDKPRIKWTHTQTAGAGNKDAYDVEAWRGYGYEFSDDNATTLLMHGDAYDTTTDNAVGFFKDSSSANSIHHAIVSGGGVHHTKAVTMSSDGTNGTSTTDPEGNTIYWCGSNSTVTFANSSTFSSYGNTSIALFDGHHLTIPDSADWDISGGNATIEFWMYHTSHGGEKQIIGQHTGSGTGHQHVYTKAGGALAVGISGVNEIATSGANGADRWNWTNFSITRDGTTTSIYKNGVRVQSATTAVWNDTSAVLSIGASGASRILSGYLNEVRWIKGAAYPPRFYLGNQTPESGGSLTAFKYADFNGTSHYYSKSASNWNVSSTQGTISAWWKADTVGSWRYIFSSADTGSTDYFFTYGVNDTGKMVLDIKDGGSGTECEIYFAGPKSHSVNTWHHSVLVHNGTTISHYLDGERQNSEFQDSAMDYWFHTINAERDNICIGAMVRSSVSAYWDGKIAQVGVWGGSSGTTGVLTEAQIKAIYKLGPSADWTSSYSSGMVGYWNFTKTTEGTSTGSTLYDQSSGSDDDLAASPALSAPTTAYHVSDSSKRLTEGPIEYSTSSTTAFGNNHYANVAAQSVTSENFGGFVDDEYTVLLLRGGGAGGNTHFTDGGVAAGETITFPAHSYSYGKSRTARIINTGGNPTHLFGLDKIHGTVIDFDGVGDYLLPPGDDAYTIPRGGDFCIEMWLYADATLSNDYFFDARGNPAVGTNFRWYFGSNTDMHWGLTNDVDVGSDAITGGVKVVNTTWTHIVVQRWKNQVMTFQDGICVDSREDAGAHDGRQPIGIGTNNAGNQTAFDGKIDELRFTNGIARYTPAGELQSGIVPAGATDAGSPGTSIPTTPYLRPTPFVAADGGRGYFANTNVKLWIKSDTYPGSTTFTDIGTSTKTITNSGHVAGDRPTLQTGTDDYALSGGSDAIYFAVEDHIRISPHKPDLDLSDGDWTVEYWYKADALSGTAGTIFVDTRSGSPEVGFLNYLDNANFNFWINATNLVTHTVAAGVWQHIAVVANGQTGIITYHADGLSVGTHTLGWPTTTTVYPWALGQRRDSASNNGAAMYMDEFRVSKMARYTSRGLKDSDYTSPSSEFEIQTEGTTYGQFDTQVTANTTYQRYNYQHSTGFTYTVFDGTNDYAHKNVANWQSSDDRGTVLAWINCDDADGDEAIFSSADTASTNNWWVMFLDRGATGGNQIGITYKDGGTVYSVRGTEPIPVKTWALVGITSSGTAWTCWQNGYTDKILTVSEGNNGGWFSDTTLRDNIVVGGRVRSTGLHLAFEGIIAQVGVWGGSSGTDGILTAAQMQAIYRLGPGGDWTTDYSTNLRGYWTFGNKTTQGTDTGSTIYDQSAASDDDLTGVSLAAPINSTQLLVHSNTAIDGDTTIVDSSPNTHLITRVVADPQYANTTVNRSSLAGASYNGILFDPVNDNDFLSIPYHPDSPFNLKAGEIFTFSYWIRPVTRSGNLWFGNTVGDSQETSGWGLYHQAGGELGLSFSYNGSSQSLAYTDSSAIHATNWTHVALVRASASSSDSRLYINGSAYAFAGSSGGWTVSTTSLTFNSAMPITPTRPFDIGGYQGAGSAWKVYLDQVCMIRGAALSASKAGHIGHANANTTWGILGGLLLHEEYCDGTNTANASTGFLLHSNNATHHSHGSRRFYNDVANTRFTGTTGHEHAGYFTVGVSGTAFTILGDHQTGHGSAMTQPSIRLKRGYSYVFAASSLGAHKFYFANSTANTTGYAYGSDASTNKHITGMYVSDTEPTPANKGSLTWTAMTSSHYLGSTDSNGYTYLKYEVPTDAPKDLYYRCGAPHGAMGNAVYVMEATEPIPVKVGNLPALKTSSWNDRDFAGIGTNKSVYNFGDGNLGGGANTAWIKVANNAAWDISGTTTNFAYEAWINRVGTKTGEPVIFGDNPDGRRISLRTDGTGALTLAVASGTGGWWTGGTRNNVVMGGTATVGSGSDYDSVMKINDNQWYYVCVYTTGSPRSSIKVAVNGELWIHVSGFTHGANTQTTQTAIGQWNPGDTYWNWCGFMDDVKISTGFADNTWNANTVIERYQTGRAGNFCTANSSLKLWVKSDTYYGNTTFLDASSTGATITPQNGVYHHIDDNRTANTALYFDGKSTYILFPRTADNDWGKESYTIEFWAKVTNEANGGCFGFTRGRGSGVQGETYYWDNATQQWQYSLWTGSAGAGSIVGYASAHTWHHTAAVYDQETGYLRMFIDGVCTEAEAKVNGGYGALTWTASTYTTLRIGKSETASQFEGFMDGFRLTKGMPRYTSGIPKDGQSPHKQYDDGRSSNTANANWTTSSTRRYYGINTHTYLQTTEYSTNANTVLLLRGDDAVVANTEVGFNMYGVNGWHLEFKDVGSDTERDYNNFHTGSRGFGTDSSSEQQFVDKGTAVQVYSRPNQSNGTFQFINERTQGSLYRHAENSTSYHAAAKSIFGADSNTANVSIASGGTRNY